MPLFLISQNFPGMVLRYAQTIFPAPRVLVLFEPAVVWKHSKVNFEF